jgi:5-methylcytosine-specific restriction protein A
MYLCSVRNGRKSVSLERAKEIFSRLGRTFDASALEKLFIPEMVRRHTANIAVLRDYVISRARGYCQLYGERAPFTGRDGRPYLEVHHVISVRDGGCDAPGNLAALWPNCHRKIEICPTAADKEKLINVLKKRQGA